MERFEKALYSNENRDLRIICKDARWTIWPPPRVWVHNMNVDSYMWGKSVKILSRDRGDGRLERFVISAQSFASHVEGCYFNIEAETAIFHLGT